MDSSKHGTLYMKALTLCKNGRLRDAADVFRRLIEEGSQDPRHLSYCGLLTATIHGQPRKGLELCERAVASGAYEPQIYLNLVRVYELTGQRQRAIEMLRRGLRQSPNDKRLLKKINELSPRQKPPLSMVRRSHPVNKQLAILLTKLRRDEGGQAAKENKKGDEEKKKIVASRFRFARQG